jgi:hypothetical protein
MALQQRYNNENIFSRSIIAGILNILNNKLSYEQAWSNEDIETVKVPWYYNMSGDERFMQDFYTHYADCIAPKPVDGNFDIIPRGVITYMGSTIDSPRITSRYVQGTFLKEINNQLQTYRSFLYSIPLTVNFDCEVWVDNQITSLKIEQAIRELWYKTVTFYVYYKGMRVGCTAGFPEDITLEKNIQQSFESMNQIKLKFSLQVETYQPVFDPTTEVPNNNYMTGIGYRLVDSKHNKNDGNIILTTDYTNHTISKGQPLLLEWEYKNENSIINRVDILWSNSGENNRNVIEKGVINNEYYVWNIPESFTSFKHPVIIWPQDGNVHIYREPLIRILPDITTGEITASSFNVLDGGYFISNTPDTSINIVLEMKDINNNLVYSGDSSIYINIIGNKIPEDGSSEDAVFLPEGSIHFPGSLDKAYKIIDLYIVNSVTGYNSSLITTEQSSSFGIIRNITII